MVTTCDPIFEDIQKISDLLDVDTTGVSTGDFLQKSAGDWVDFDLFGTANTWGAAQTFSTDTKAQFWSSGNFIHAFLSNGLAIEAETLIRLNINSATEVTIINNLLSFNQVTTHSTISWFGATGLVFNAGTLGYEFDIDSSPEVTIAANTMTFNQTTTNSKISWAGARGLAFDVGVSGYDFQIASTSEVVITANLQTFTQDTTNSTISWAGTTGLVFDVGVAGYEFDIGGSPEVTIAANTMTFEQGAIDFILDWSIAGELKWTWAGSGVTFSATGLNPSADNATSLGNVTLGFSGIFVSDDGAVNFRGGTTPRIGSDAANELEVVAPNIINQVIGSTDVFRCDAAGVQILGSTTDPANAGEVHLHTADKSLKFDAGHGACGFMGLAAQTTAAESEIGASTTSEIDFATTKAFGADDLTAGYVIPIRFAGVMDSAATSVATVRVELHGAGETTILSFVTASGNVSADKWYLEAVIHVATTGATGTVAASGRLFAKSTLLISTTASVTIDTTEALTVAVSVQFDKSNVGNGMTAHTASFQAGMV